MNNAIKQELHQLVENCNNELSLEEAKALFQCEKDWWEELTIFTGKNINPSQLKIV